MSTPTTILVLDIKYKGNTNIVGLNVEYKWNITVVLSMLLVLPIRAKDSCNKVRARERESANPGDGKPLGADVDTVLVTAPLSSHRFVLVCSKLYVFNLLLLGKVCSAGEVYQLFFFKQF